MATHHARAAGRVRKGMSDYLPLRPQALPGGGGVAFDVALTQSPRPPRLTDAQAIRRMRELAAARPRYPTDDDLRRARLALLQTELELYAEASVACLPTPG